MKFSTFLGYTLAVTGIALTASILPASAKSDKPASAKPEKPGKSNTKEVPEPLTILGSAAALGLGSMLKKQADKNKNQAIAQDTLS